MTTDPASIARPDVPTAAGEVETLRAFLESQRATVRRQAAGLNAEQLATALAPSPMTLGGMLKHLTFVEHWWFQVILRDRPAQGVWSDVDWDADPDWDWHSAVEDTPAELDAMLVAEVGRSEEALEEALALDGLDTRARRGPHGGPGASLRWILLHMIEEYSRHCGHADLLRESIDGTTAL